MNDILELLRELEFSSGYGDYDGCVCPSCRGSVRIHYDDCKLNAAIKQLELAAQQPTQPGYTIDEIKAAYLNSISGFNDIQNELEKLRNAQGKQHA